MSRIQNILDKAEREGTLRPIAPIAESMGGPGVATLDSPQIIVRTSIASGEAAAAAALPLPDVVPPRVVRGSLAPTLTTALAPESTTAEQYRALRTRLLHADTGRAMHLLLVTSACAGDGKSLTAVNLALTMAQDEQQRIVIVDANLRSPQVHQLLGILPAPGLSDVLSGSITLEDALVRLEEQQLAILPGGSPTGRPAELLGSIVMRRVLDTLRSKFDRVVIDAPAAVPLADVGILMPQVDGLALIVRAGVTPKPAIQSALDAVDRDKLLGVVLNAAVA